MNAPPVVVVAHPFARGAPKSVRSEIVRAWEEVGEVQVRLTTSPGEGARLARAAAEDGARVVVALGGDGTFNSVASGLVGTSTAFAPIPAGSTNVLPRALGLPNDALAAARLLARAVCDGVGAQLPISHAGGQVFLANAGIGFDAEVVRLAESHAGLKRRSSPAAFLWATARTLAAPHRGFRLTIDDIDEPLHAELLSVQNVSPYTYLGSRPLEVAGRHGILPRFTLLVVPHVSSRVLAKVFAEALRGRLEQSAAGGRVLVLTGVSRVEVHAAEAVPLQVDGEPSPPARQISFVHKTSSVPVFLPATSAAVLPRR
ncbi:MAG: hypothetical protein GEV08_05700 [Acidimicrobiia bacterium]|nr:hypothetical protein [Acidimicrobiia bacterium]